MKRLVIYITLVFSVLSFCHAQQLPHFRNANLNHFYWNPAYIANNEAPDVLLNHRSQWVGFSGAPKISSLAGKYSFRDDMAAGLYLMNDMTGISRKLDMGVNYAYLLRADMFNISFGLSWTLTQFRILGTEITIYDESDQTVNMALDDMTWKPDANAGIVFFNEDFSFGLGISQLFQTRFMFFDDNNVPGTMESRRHFFLSGTYNLYSHNGEHRFTPFLNTYFSQATPVKFDLGFKYTGSNNIIASLFYSNSDAIVFSAGYRYENFFFEYAFDMVTSRLRNVSSGAHEITLGMFIPTKTKPEVFRPMF